MFKALLSFAFLFPTFSHATGYLIHKQPSGERIQITGVTSTKKPNGHTHEILEVHLLSGPEGTYQCSFPFSALQAEGYNDLAAFTSMLANPSIRTNVYCYTESGKAGSTTAIMIDTRF